VSGEEALGPGRKDVWALADNAVLAKIAANSLDAIMGGARSPDSAPSAEPEDTSPETGTPMAALPSHAVAFNDSAR
jgi:hypothetical protein